MLTNLGPFQILEVIGRGGMGTVYRAIDPIIRRPVAIKVIRLVGYNDSDEQTWLRERLFREARAAGCLNHPGIVTIYQVGEEQDVAYIAMEFVDGSTMQDLMAGQNPMDKLSLCRVVRDAASALDYAHECGLVHRDIKPANIMVTVAGKTKVTDFGIAKTSFGLTTKTGMILGTPYYMSPEQIRGEALDGRSDQFALAVVAYEVVTGRRPFDAELPTSVCYQIIHQDPVSPADIDPSLGPEVAAVLAKALAKDAAARYANCTEFAEALLNGFILSSTRRKAMTGETVVAASPRPAITATIPIPPIPAKTSHAKTAAAVLFGLAAVIGILLVSFKTSRAPSAPTARAVPVPITVREKVLPVPSAQLDPKATAPPSVAAIKPRPIAPIIKIGPVVSTGALVWTGRLNKGGLLTITKGHASSGTLVGTLPGTPITILIHPAEMDKAGLTVFTANPQYATPSSVSTPKGNALFTFDPRHATDIAVFEAPAAQNEWAKLVMRINNPKIEACVIEWFAEP